MAVETSTENRRSRSSEEESGKPRSTESKGSTESTESKRSTESTESAESKGSTESKEGTERKQQSLLRRAAPSLPYVLGGLLLVGYFVWMLLEMSSDAPGGGAVPLSIFGAVLLGVLAGAASILSSRRQKK